MICSRCAEAADGVDFGPVEVCSECGAGPVSVYRTDLPRDLWSVVKHKVRFPDGRKGKSWCSGSLKPPRKQTGHDFCNGCDCQHAEPGSWKGSTT